MTRDSIEKRRRFRKEREMTSDSGAGKVYDSRILRHLWTFVVPHRVLFFTAMLSYPFAALFQLAQPWIVKEAVDKHMKTQQLDGFWVLIAAFIGVIVLEFGARFYQTILTQLLGQRVTKDLRLALFDKLQKVDIGFIERNPIGRMMTRVTNDVESIGEAFSLGAVSILGDIVMLTGIIIMMFYMNVQMTLYAFAVLPVLIAVILFFRPYSRDAFRAVRLHLARINGFLNEAISGMAIIQVFRQEREMAREFEEVNSQYRDANFQSILYDAMTYAIVEGVGTVAIALMVLFGARDMVASHVELGVLVAFIDLVRRFFAPITELSTKYTIIQSAMTSAERCIDLLGEKPSVVDAVAPKQLPPLSTALRFEDVSFGYGKDGPTILTSMSFTVKKGEKVAIVGPTGAGKSTIVKLIARFYDPSSGRVTIDGTDLRELGLDDLRKRLAVVMQDPYLFDGTVRENIAFGHDALTQEMMEAAARRTQASVVIQKLPEGWESTVGERGAKLSSGERQLIAFARALALDPEILVLDEATSAVDPETESIIQKGLEALIEDRTAVIIAHRLSTIRRADRILVIAAGRVVEEGSHDELLAKGGVYKKLYELQFAEAAEPAAA